MFEYNGTKKKNNKVETQYQCVKSHFCFRKLERCEIIIGTKNLENPFHNDRVLIKKSL